MLGAAACAITAVDPGTEIVTAGIPGSTLGVTLERYVRDAITSLGRLGRTLHIRGVVYFDWRDAPPYPAGATSGACTPACCSATAPASPRCLPTTRPPACCESWRPAAAAMRHRSAAVGYLAGCVVPTTWPERSLSATPG
jgi:hypothetical protein